MERTEDLLLRKIFKVLHLANVRIVTGHDINDDSQRSSIPGGVDVFQKNHVSEFQIFLYGVPFAAKLECLHVGLLLLPPCPEPICQDLDSFPLRTNHFIRGEVLKVW